MMTIQNKIEKKAISEMPRAEFQGEIIVVDDVEKVEKATFYLRQQRILGIDSETRPSFVKGRMHKVGLLQISTHEYCYLFRLNKIGLPKDLIILLEDKKTVKVGLSLKDDFMMLHKRAPFQQQACIDLQNIIGEFGVEDRSLQKIFANLFQQKISKAQRLSNWEAGVLSPAQQKYAALDAWACLAIYERLEEMKEKGYNLEKTATI